MPKACRSCSRGSGDSTASAASAENVPVVPGRKKNMPLRHAAPSVHETSTATTKARSRSRPVGARPAAASSSVCAISAANTGAAGRITPGS
jgi:hypothetical protein